MNLAHLEVIEFWRSGRAREAGRRLSDLIPLDRQPRWAVGILHACLGSDPIRTNPDFENILWIAQDQYRWNQGKTALGRLIMLQRQTERRYWFGRKRRLLLLDVAELTAMITFNASAEPRERFISDLGGQIAETALAFVKLQPSVRAVVEANLFRGLDVPRRNSLSPDLPGAVARKPQPT